MRKLTAALLVLLFAGMQNLVAEGHEEKEGKLTVTVNPYAKGSGKIYLSGDEYRQLKNPVAGGEAKVNFKADYNGIGGVQVDLKGALAGKKTDFGLGDNAFAYIHILQAFGVDKKIFDVYLKSGRFELGFGKGGALGRDGQINMQLDMKILDMVTVTTGVGFRPFEQAGSINKDIGFMVKFAKTFAGAHNISASVGYSVDLTNNDGNDMNGKSKVGTTKESDAFLEELAQWEKNGPGLFPLTPPATLTDKQKKALKEARKESNFGYYFDQFGFDLAYEGTFGMIKLKPFFGLTLKGLVAKPVHSYASTNIGWNAGLRFALRDKDNGYDMVYTQLDFDGNMRANNNHIRAVGKDIERDYITNDAFKGFKVTLGSHALKALMGKQYLSFETFARFDLNDPKKLKNGVDVQRKGFLSEFKFSAVQRLLAVDSASVNLSLAFGLKNIAPFYYEGFGYIGDTNVANLSLKHAALQSYIDIGLDANFTAKVERMVK